MSSRKKPTTPVRPTKPVRPTPMPNVKPTPAQVNPGIFSPQGGRPRPTGPMPAIKPTPAQINPGPLPPRANPMPGNPRPLPPRANPMPGNPGPMPAIKPTPAQINPGNIAQAPMPNGGMSAMSGNFGGSGSSMTSPSSAPMMKRGGQVKAKQKSAQMPSRSSTSSASKRADGIATRGKTKCKMC